MITERGLVLLAKMDDQAVDWKLSLDCLQSSNLFEQGVGFGIVTSRFRDEIVPKIPTNTDVPMLLLEYLLNCIKADITPECEELCEGFVYNKGGAFLNLRVPLDPYWKKYNCELTEDRFFQRIADFLLEKPDEYQSRLPTHVLEAWSPNQKPFAKIMRSWRNDPVLKRYVEDLEAISSV